MSDHDLHQTDYGWRCTCGQKFFHESAAILHVETEGDDE